MKVLFTSFVKTYFSSDKHLYRYIRNIFGIYPENIFLYKLAFRHKSVAKEVISGVRVSNERLEYLGDAVLSATVADFLFKKFPLKDEGFLTEMRSKIVNRSQLNKISKKLGLDKFIESDQDTKSICKSINGDTFEAFIGALYLDKGYKLTKKIIVDRIINVHYDIDELEKQENNYKSKLLEWAQKEKHEISFNVTKEKGDSYNKQYEVEIIVNNKKVSTAFDFSIKGAEQIASEKAFLKISRHDN